MIQLSTCATVQLLLFRPSEANIRGVLLPHTPLRSVWGIDTKAAPETDAVFFCLQHQLSIVGVFIY